MLVLLAGAAWVTACGDGTTEPPPVDPPRATTVSVIPAALELAALGATVRLMSGDDGSGWPPDGGPGGRVGQRRLPDHVGLKLSLNPVQLSRYCGLAVGSAFAGTIS